MKHMDKRKRNNNTKNRFTIIALTIVVLVLIVGGTLLLRGRQQRVSAPSLVMKSYTDPDNYFSIQTPSTWRVATNSGSGTVGIGTANQITQKVEIAQFVSNQGTRVGLSVQVYEGQPACAYLKAPNTTFANLPAFFDGQSLWIIPTQTATYVIAYHYPGANPREPASNLTVPQALITAEKRVLPQMFAAFHINQPRPAHC
jgi:hypothetical protein